MKFDRASLEAEGFNGWLPFPEARASSAIPATGGVHVVIYTGGAPAAFLPENPGGRFKGKDPTVPASALAATRPVGPREHVGQATARGHTTNLLTVFATSKSRREAD